MKSIIPRILFNYIQSFQFLKNHHFGKRSHLIFLYIIEQDVNIVDTPTNPITKSGGLDTTNPTGMMPMA